MTNELYLSRETLEKLARKAYGQLMLPLPDLDTTADVEMMRRYLSSNPDITPQALAQALAQLEEKSELAPNVVDISGPATRSILNERVREIELALADFDPGRRFRRTCFGSVPGGGLDASSFKLEGSDEYAIVIPEGFFHLTNLMTKLVILLHPLTPSVGGPVFMPTASFEQLALLRHPYVVFRYRDLLEGFFLWGDPKAALPYPRAIPYQDRFAYLLVGTELFVLAHELAHVVLGHFERSSAENSEALELEADELALTIVTAYFRSAMNYPVARASLCGFLFISMVKVWEAGLERLTGDPHISSSLTHPVSSARFERYATALAQAADDETPLWYIYTHNAIKYLAEVMLPATLDEVSKEAETGNGISARVLPRSHQYLGHFNGADHDRWWFKLAGMIASADDGQHRLGLGLFVAYLPSSAIGLYRGIVDDDEAVRTQCEAALVAIEPMYASYIPRLKERYRETAMAEEFDAYLDHLSMFLGAAASAKLGHVADLDPMDPRFFATGNDEQDVD